MHRRRSARKKPWGLYVTTSIAWFVLIIIWCAFRADHLSKATLGELLALGLAPFFVIWAAHALYGRGR